MNKCQNLKQLKETLQQVTSEGDIVLTYLCINTLPFSLKQTLSFISHLSLMHFHLSLCLPIYICYYYLRLKALSYSYYYLPLRVLSYSYYYYYLHLKALGYSYYYYHLLPKGHEYQPFFNATFFLKGKHPALRLKSLQVKHKRKESG